MYANAAADETLTDGAKNGIAADPQTLFTFALRKARRAPS